MENAMCLVELDEVLNMLSKEDLNKIPEDIRMSIREGKDTNYTWKYDTTKELKDQNLNRKTITMLAYLNMEYLVNEEQRKFLQQMHLLNEQKAEKEKQEKYKAKDLFQKSSEEKTTEEVALVKYDEGNFITKLFRKIRAFFSKNNRT